MTSVYFLLVPSHRFVLCVSYTPSSKRNFVTFWVKPNILRQTGWGHSASSDWCADDWLMYLAHYGMLGFFVRWDLILFLTAARYSHHKALVIHGSFLTSESWKSDIGKSRAVFLPSLHLYPGRSQSVRARRLTVTAFRVNVCLAQRPCQNQVITDSQQWKPYREVSPYKRYDPDLDHWFLRDKSTIVPVKTKRAPGCQ